MSEIQIKIKRLSDEYNDLPLPKYATTGSAGLDITAAVKDVLLLPKGKIALVPTNLSVEIPEGYEIQVRPRSGLAIKHGVTVLNTPGTIDSDYRGEIKIILINLGEADYQITRGERIAQLVPAKVHYAEFRETSELNETHRGEGGFGHSGK